MCKENVCNGVYGWLPAGGTRGQIGSREKDMCSEIFGASDIWANTPTFLLYKPLVRIY